MEILGLGIDFANDYTQVCYVTQLENDDPVSMSTVSGEQRYLIPTIMYKDRNLNKWYIGEEALAMAKGNGGSCIENIPGTIINQGENAIFSQDGEKYTCEELIYYFFKELFNIIKRILDFEIIHDICVAVEKPEGNIIGFVHKALKKLGYIEENMRVIDHAEAFIYYTMNQKKDIWVNDVVLFDFSKDHFSYSKLKTIRTRTPKTITVDESDYSDVIDFKMLDTPEGKMKADKKFFQIIQDNFRKSVISAVFLTGSGFYEDWAKDSLPELCGKRRVFMGYNLFVKGSTYSALKRYKGISSNEYLFDCTGRTKVNINLLIMHNGRNMALSLSKAGTNWYEAGAVTECILDDINKIQVIFEEPISMMRKNMFIELHDFPERPNKTTRVKITLGYEDDINCIIKVEDMGFGELFKSSGANVLKEINIEELF